MKKEKSERIKKPEKVSGDLRRLKKSIPFSTDRAVPKKQNWFSG
ncbi:MAG: hypothetical protein AB9861_05555 [Methanosarcina sp.]